MAEEQVAATKEERSTGRVVRFSDKKGFGFIKPDAGDKDLFVHHSAIKSDGGYRTLYEDDVVEFTILLTDDKCQAVDVTAPGGGPIKRRTTFSGGFNRRNSNTNGGGCFNCGNPGHIARDVGTVGILRGSVRRGIIIMGVTVVEGLDMLRGTARISFNVKGLCLEKLDFTTMSLLKACRSSSPWQSASDVEDSRAEVLKFAPPLRWNPSSLMFDWVRISGLSAGLMKYQPSGLLMI
ncbi:hypothetical protein NC651_013295 [Populus alba x Populus x berolinensis]|nr:hypothetical protein NC651_013295 [Populus alba x Populus x berolinensis]